MVYARQLTGGVFVRYGRRKGGHHFWYVPLARLYDRSTLDGASARPSRSTSTPTPAPPSATPGPTNETSAAGPRGPLYMS